jgi:TonB family protein
MKKSILVSVSVSLCLVLFLSISALAVAPMSTAPSLNAVILMRIYEGFRGETGASTDIVSSYFLKPLGSDHVYSEVERIKEQATLKRVFNLTDIEWRSELTMETPKAKSNTPPKIIVLSGRKLAVQLSAVVGNESKFQVEVIDKTDNISKSLLSSKIILPEQKTTVIGFEDSSGKIFFLSFHRMKDASLSLNPIKSPKLLRKVEPIYPKEAQEAHISGQVMIQASTDINGNISDTKVVEGPEQLREAAVTAIRQWKYEPFIMDGKAKPIHLTVIVSFNLQSKPKDEPINLASKNHPNLIKKVEPKYPVEAFKKNIQGKVVIEATTDPEGNVVDVKVVDGVEGLNEAAAEAIKQWKYEPYFVKGVKKAVRLTVIVKFNLKHNKKKEAPVKK